MPPCNKDPCNHKMGSYLTKQNPGFVPKVAFFSDANVESIDDISDVISTMVSSKPKAEVLEPMEDISKPKGEVFELMEDISKPKVEVLEPMEDISKPIESSRLQVVKLTYVDDGKIEEILDIEALKVIFKISFMFLNFI